MDQRMYCLLNYPLKGFQTSKGLRCNVMSNVYNLEHEQLVSSFVHIFMIVTAKWTFQAGKIFNLLSAHFLRFW